MEYYTAVKKQWGRSIRTDKKRSMVLSEKDQSI